MNITNLTLSKIVADENQPRKYFDESKMGSLRKSIKAHGIKNPLIVELQKDGTYLLIDGERRYRASKELGLKSVPAIIQPTSASETQRLIEQFHIQEQHEGWSAVEKAGAVTKLADSMNISIAEVGKILGIPEGTARNYIAFAKVIDKKNFERSRIGINFAGRINSLRGIAKKICLENDIQFDRTAEKKLENAVYARLNEGEELKGNFFTKLIDSFKQDPDSIKEFIENDKMTVDELFTKTKARGALYLRQLTNSAGYITLQVRNFMKSPTTNIEPHTFRALKQAMEDMKVFINKYE